MGLIRAFTGALGGTLADQWKEFFYCEALENNVLMTKGVNRITKRSSNRKGNDNIISNGSGVAVADGQCMIIVEQGKIVEFCSEPGEYTFNSSTEPSIFASNLGQGLADIIKTTVRRFGYGGDTGKDQRVYYFNMKELVDNKFGTATPIPFRVVDSRIGLDIDVSLRCYGVFSYKIANPVLFYQNVCGNVAESYTREQLDSQLKTEFVSALQPAFGRLSEKELRPNQILTHTKDLEDAMNEALSQKWKELRGLEVVSIALGSVTLPPEDAELIKKAQQSAIYRDPSMAAATLVTAQADAMRAAAENKNGAMTGFMGMGMAMNAGGVNAQNLYAMGEKQRAENPAPAQKSGQEGWKCPVCGTQAKGKFCPECGAKKPEEKKGWTCSCGTVNMGKFCCECGAKKPKEALLYRCDKCGWEPEDPAHPPKFCPECGDPFDDKDVK